MPFADDDQLLAVNDVLAKFASKDPRKAELLKLRYIVGMSFEEAAAALDIAVANGETMGGLCPGLFVGGAAQRQ